MLRSPFLIIAAVVLASCSGRAVDLRPATDAAFHRYVQLSEQRMQSDMSSGSFLWVDGLPGQQSQEVNERLKRGEVVTQRLETFDHGASIPVPGGLIHHWIGVVFIPGAGLQRTLALVQNYDEHARIYAPRVLRSKLVRRDGDDFKVSLRLRDRNVVTVVLDTEYDVHYVRLDPARARSQSYSTRVAEVERVGQRDEYDKSVGTTTVICGVSIHTGASGSAMVGCTSNWKRSRLPATFPRGWVGWFVPSSQASRKNR
jgi:hypothetical protein